MIDSLMTIMSSSGLGAITGGFFGWLSRREDRKSREKDQQHKIELLRVQSDANRIAGDISSFAESQKTISKISDAIKSCVRPIITGLLLFMTYQILEKLELLTGGIANFSADQASLLYRDITLNIISLTATAVSWWFASRPSSISK